MLKAIFKVSMLIGLASLASRLLGLYREHLLSKIFGGIAADTNILDSYYIAFRIPDFVYNIMLLGVGTAILVPLYTHIKDRRDELDETFWTINTGVFGFVLILCMIAYLTMPWLVENIFFSHRPEITETATILSRIMLLSPILFSISTLIGSYLQSFRIYIFSQLSPVLYNLGIIIGILYLYPRYGINGLGYGVALGAALHLVIQLPWLLNKIPRFQIGKIGYRNLIYCIRQTILRGFTLASNQLNLVIDSIISGFLPSGSLSLYNWTQNIYYLPI